MSTTVSIRFKFRRGTAAEWTASNPVLLAGEPGLETDTGKMKYGDGVTAWGSLSYFTVAVTSGQITTALGYTPYDAANPSGYVTTSGARSALSSGTGISYNSGTGVIGVNSVLAAYAGGDMPSAFTLGIVDSVDAAAFRSAIGAPSLTGTGASGTWGISVSGNAATVTDGVYTSGSYANPSWITSLAAAKVTGLATVATSGSYNDLSDKPGLGVRSNGQQVVTTSTTLDGSHKGANILILNPGVTVTFPSSGYASGEGVAISNVSGGNVTLAFPGGSDIGTTLPNNGTFFAFCDGGGYWRQYGYSSTKL